MPHSLKTSELASTFVKKMSAYVYILTNENKSVLYTGVTTDLQKRMLQHRNHTFGGFTADYNLTRLVYFEEIGDVRDAIAREKLIKMWANRRKVKLINTMNPAWRDLMPATDE